MVYICQLIGTPFTMKNLPLGDFIVYIYGMFLKSTILAISPKTKIEPNNCCFVDVSPFPRGIFRFRGSLRGVYTLKH